MVRPRPVARGEHGQILVLTALSMTMLLAVTALSIDASYMYDRRNRLHAAADAAAKIGAAEVLRHPSVTTTPALKNFAWQQVTQHGLTPDDCGSTTIGHAAVCVNHPPIISVPFAGNMNYVEVIVSATTSTFFGNMLGWAILTPGARAVAGPITGPNCIVAQGLTSPGVHLEAGVVLTMPGCNIADNMALNNQGTIQAKEIDITPLTCTGNCTGVTTGVTGASDPLEALPPPSDPGGSCSSPLAVSGTMTISAGKYCGWTLSANAILHLNAGIYYITGPITGGNNVTIDGSGVMINLAGNVLGGSIVLDQLNPTVTLSAPTSGPYLGILFYQNRSNNQAATLGKDSGLMTLSGTMYFPSADVTMNRNSAGDCAVFVVNSIDLRGNAALSNTCTAYGGSSILTITTAE